MKFTIVTPTFNSERFLPQTLASVVSQAGDFAIEHIIVDNLSRDTTPKIVDQYRQDACQHKQCQGTFEVKFISARDNGMYEAINRGFAEATGDIYAWINSDDIYQGGALAAIVSAFRLAENVRWVKGITDYIDEYGLLLRRGRCYLYAQELISYGLYGREAYFIQQAGVFWRAELWHAVGGLDDTLKVAGDYDLWIKFARIEPLYALNRSVSCFRQVRGQLSEDLGRYRGEQRQIKTESSVRGWLLGRYFFFLEPRAPRWLSFIVFRSLYPSAPLYCIDGEGEEVTLSKFFRYIV